MDPTYQIFHTKVKWSQDIVVLSDWQPSGWWIEGLPAGRMWSSVHRHDIMPKEETTVEQIEGELREWWPTYLPKLIEKHGDLDYQDIEFIVEEKPRATWAEGWFSHWTYDVGQTDAEVLDSFERYVQERELANYRAGQERGYGLMGADERWRWAARAVGFGESTSAPPCRCEHCKAQGVVRIDH